MGRALNRLTAIQVNKLKTPGMHADGGGLYLRVSDAGAKSWIFRFTLGGKLRDMGLGGANAVPLAAARKRAAEYRELRANGIDPIEHHRASVAQQRATDAKSLTFKECAGRYIASHEARWGHRQTQAWTGTIRDYCGPIAALPVRMIEVAHVMQVLMPIWTTKTVTAGRLRGRIEAVLDWAKVSGFRDGDNPARWRGHLKHLLPAPGDMREVKHHAALPYVQMSIFMPKLRANSSPAARCIEFFVLTAARLDEARCAVWDEIDFEAQTWTVPAARMKERREHRVPLSKPALALLKEMWGIRRGPYIFTGMRDGPVASVTCLQLAKQIAGAPITNHGFRSSFRDWAAEQTDFPRELAEMSLSHAVGDAVERAYQRSDLFDRRRKLMQDWADYCG